MELTDLAQPSLAGAKTVTATPGDGLAGGSNEMILKASQLASEIAGTAPLLAAKKKGMNEPQVGG